MKAIPHCRASSSEPAHASINVSVLCSGNKARRIAAQTLTRIDGLLREGAAPCDFRAHWSFVAQLFVHEHFKAAVEATVGANLVVVSFSTHEPLPLVMIHWMEHWVPRKRGEDAALIALLHGRAAPEEFSPVENLLRSSAQATGLSLFVHHFQQERESVSPKRRAHPFDRVGESHVSNSFNP